MSRKDPHSIHENTKIPQKKSPKEVIKILEESLVLICWVDNLFPGNNFVGELYYKIYDLKRDLEFWEKTK